VLGILSGLQLMKYNKWEPIVSGKFERWVHLWNYAEDGMAEMRNFLFRIIEVNVRDAMGATKW